MGLEFPLRALGVEIPATESLAVGASLEKPLLSFQFPVSIRLAAYPAGYPFDWYSASFRWSVSIPQPDTYLDSDNGFTFTFPERTFVSFDAALSGYEADARLHEGQTRILISRTADIMIWNVLLLLTCPAILFVLLCSSLFGPFGTARTDLLAISLSLLAILPIRQVVVPADVGYFSFADALLAFWVVAMLGVALIVDAFQTRHRHVHEMPAID